MVLTLIYIILNLMRRERELKLLRKKRLLKRYSDFELSLLASEMNDYTYLLKSIQFPKEELDIIKNEKEDKNEDEKEEKELPLKNSKNNIVKFKKLISFGDSGNNLIEIKEKEESENESEEYEGLKPNNKINIKKKKRI